ncbi:MAG: SDR family oxidoreductase [Spirochaeta sp.]|jgi:NAD(P)-dependent dehydrogenase (short-subunit alcohol dehydrogenase family)|nr:SDR family oxidoreductase [Spirochaeta sp.]
MSYAEQMFSLTDEIAIVTGGAGVLPSAMATTMLRAGARVALWGRGTNHPVQEAVEKLVRETGVSADRMTAVTVDTADEQAVEAAFDQTVSDFGMPTILVNGVGGNSGKGDFVDIDVTAFEQVVSLNLLAGLVIPLKACARRWMDAGQDASVINLASMTSYKGLSGVWAYNAAKSAVLNLTEGAAKEFAPHGIRVNGIAPGFFLGYQNRALLVADDQTGELTARGQAIIDRTPFGRFGKMEDIEGATLFLASRRAAGFVTGVTIPVDGGYLVDNI